MEKQKEEHKSNTVVIYNNNTLLHKTTREHPETPNRVSETIQHLQNCYINKDTFKSAISAAQCSYTLARGLQKGDYQNGFAIIRPPGHHAGNVDNNCHGFCFFNNAAIVCQTLKQVVLFDWDIHHGDGSENIFYETKDVLYISIHRYDNGIFFPKTGNCQRVGQNQGEGYNINIGFNIENDTGEVYGDGEMIFLLERIVLPIIQEFKPDFIVISAGFDGCIKDPVGGCQLSSQSFSYALEKLLKIQSKIILLLEGGYNVQNIINCSESLLRIFQNEKMPFKHLNQSKTIKQMYELVPNNIAIKCVEKCLPIFKKYWQSLSDISSTDYHNQMLEKNKVYNSLSGGHLTNVVIDNEIYLKEAKKNEIEFYEDLDNKNSQFYEQNQLLKEFIPKYYGLKTIDGKNYLQLENMIYNKEKGSIIDIKFGRITCWDNANEEKKQKQELKSIQTTSYNLFYRIVGMVIKDRNGDVKKRLRAGEGNYLLNEQHTIQDDNNYVKEQLSQYFLSNDALEPNKKIIQDIISFLDQYIQFYDTINTRRFVGTSLVIILDNIQQQANMKIVDFNYYAQCDKDDNTLNGLINLKKLLEEII